MGRKLTPEEAAAEGLPPPPTGRRRLTPEEAAAEGLLRPGDPGFDWAASAKEGEAEGLFRQGDPGLGWSASTKEGEAARAAKGLTLEQARAGERDLPAEPPPESSRRMSLPRAMGHRLLNAQTQGWSDEAVGSLTNLLMPLKGPMDGLYYKRSDGSVVPVTDEEGVRRAARDWERKDIKESMTTLGKLDLPVAMVGDVMGQLALPKVLTAGLGGALRLGGVNGLGNSEAELKDGQFGQAVADTAVGSAASGLGYGVGKGLGWATKKTIAPLLRRAGISAGRRAIMGGTQTLEVDKPLSDRAVEEVIRSGGIPAGRTVEGVAQKISGIADKAGEDYGRVLKGLAEAGATGPDATALGVELLDEAARVEANTLDDPLPSAFRRIVKQLERRPTDPSGKLGLLQVEQMKRTLQKLASKDFKKPETSLAGEARMAAANRLKVAIEKSVADAAEAAPEASPIRELAGQFIPAKARDSLLIQARQAAVKGASRAAKRSAITPTDYWIGGPAIAAAMSTGEWYPLLAPVANHLARSRGASTFAAGSYGLGQLLGSPEAVGELGAGATRGLTPYILDLLRGGEAHQP